MQAIILAGGFGTRLRPLTYTIPKPMLPVAGKPAMGHIIESLANAGCSEVIVTTNYLAELVADGLYALNPPIPVRCVTESKPLGTCGCVKNVIHELEDEFLVIQGDAVSYIDYKELINFHHERDADVTISVMRVQDTREFGIVAMDADGRVNRFQEKPRPEEAFSQLANSGFYVLKKWVFDQVPFDETYDFSRQLFPALLAQNARVFSREMREYWVDIGRVQNYLEGNLHFIKGCATIDPTAIVSDSATLLPPFIIGAGSHIGNNCVIGPGTVMNNRCIVGDGAHISGSVLFDDVIIGPESRLTDCVVASNSRLGDHVHIEPLSVIGAGCDIGAHVQVCAHSRIGPLTPVSHGTEVNGIVSPRLQKLEGLQRFMAQAPDYKDLPLEQLSICALLANSGEMTARQLSESGEISRTKVHTVITALEARGIILATLDVPKRYALTHGT